MRIPNAFLPQTLLAALNLVSSAVAQDQAWWQTQQESSFALDRHLHMHPELSFHEKATASRMAQELRSLGLEVHEGGGGNAEVIAAR